MSDATSSPLVVENLRVAYGDRVILDGIDFALRKHEVLVILGPSGCGKSTLLRTLIGLVEPARGRALLLGQDLRDLPRDERRELLREIGVAFQGSALLGSLTVGENVALPLREHTQLDPNTIEIMTRLKLGQVGLPKAENLYPDQLSGGMKKRAGIARALAMDPKLLFLDEPSAGLDPITSASLDQLLKQLASSLDLTTVVVTHELESAFDIADRMLMLHAGKVLALGTPDELRRNEDPRVRQFLDRLPDPEQAPSEGLVERLTRGSQ
ncbi:MAG: ABC transporter ATP-binding protein [Acidobacteriota bacterium]